MSQIYDHINMEHHVPNVTQHNYTTLMYLKPYLIHSGLYELSVPTFFTDREMFSRILSLTLSWSMIAVAGSDPPVSWLCANANANTIPVAV